MTQSNRNRLVRWNRCVVVANQTNGDFAAHISYFLDDAQRVRAVCRSVHFRQ
jgi:hypothetical protein